MTQTDTAPGSTFIGRERELGELRAGLAAERLTRSSLFLLRGDAGIGKTRLAQELTREAGQNGHAVYWGRCVEGTGAPSFWPWTQIVRAMAGDGAAQAPEGERASLARLTHAAEATTPASLHADASPSERAWMQAEGERFQLFDAVTQLLQRHARQSPLGIVLDDLHIADLPSLLLLEFIARQNVPSLWVIGTYREVEAQTDPQRRDGLARITRLGHSLTLRGLAAPDVERMIEHVIGTALPSAWVRRVSELTEGNPFFVDEVARLLQSQPHRLAGEPAAQIPVPSGVRDVVQQRVRRLSTACARMLQAAAVLGRELSFPLLREVAAMDALPLLDLIEEARAVKLLEPRPGHRLAFGHALMREALYDDLSASARVDLHRRAGAAIERLYATRLDDHLAELAYHFARVAPTGHAEKSLDYAERAARQATRALAYEDAAELYDLALDTLPLLPDDVRHRYDIDLLLALGDVRIRAGDTPRARDAFERAAAVARERNDPSSLARAAIGCGACGLGVPQGTVDRALIALLEDALAQPAHAFGQGLRVRLLARLALELYFSDAVARRQQLMREAWMLADEIDEPTRAALMHARLVGLWDVTNPTERMRWSEELIELAQRLGDGELVLRGHSYRLLEIIDTGLADAWEPALDAITRITERMREPRLIGMAIGTRAMRSVWVGRFAEAEALGTQALEIAQSVRDLNTPISIAAQSFFMLRLRGEADEIEAAARAIFTGAPTIPGTRCMIILALCGLGRHDEARAELEQLGDTDFDLLRGANRLASLMPWLSEAAAALGDRARMESLYRDLLPLSGRNITLQARICFGPVDFYLGLLAAGMNRQAEALQRFAAASALATRGRGRPLTAWIQTEHARVLLAMGAQTEAHALLTTAGATTTALGMHAITRKIDALARGGSVNVQAARDALVVAPPMRTRGASLRRDGTLWTIAFGGTVLRCKPSKGLQYLAQLLRHPGKSFHVAEILALDDRDPHASRSVDAAPLAQTGMHVGAPQVGEPVTDAKALGAYRSRLEDLAAELDEATGFNDLARSASIHAEIDVLTQALLSAVGFGGRLRSTGSFVERARLNVTRAIRSAIRRIGEGHPDLARHLSHAVRTGVFCRYAPRPDDAIRWEL